jgi:peptidoglycan/LPS O-acetylase OafA/YrhL
MNKVSSIQLLRGFASLLVLFLHALNTLQKEGFYLEGYLYILDIGHIGVDIFFIVSGFVMLYTLSSNKSASQFLIKRVIRVMPVYWATLIVIIIIYLMYPGLVNGGRESSILGSVFLIPSADLFLNQNAWTLTYEFLFYLFFSAVFLFKGTFKLLIVVVIIIFLVLVGTFYDFENGILKYATSSLLVEFLYGFVLYFFFVSFSRLQKKLYLLFVFFVLLFIQFIDVKSEYRLVYLGIPALFLCSFVVYFENYISKNLEKVTDFFGNISYSLYLVHPMSLAATSIALKKLEVIQLIVFFPTLLLVSIFSGWFTYCFLERPLTKKIQLVYFRYSKV